MKSEFLRIVEPKSTGRRRANVRLCIVEFAGALLAALALGACSPVRFVDVPAETQSERVDHLVIHFTGESFAESLRLLTERTSVPVSVHYLVPESGDPTYTRRRLRVYRLVEEGRRAWHAGDSHWRGVTALNARSIGIEIVNRSQCTLGESSTGSIPTTQPCVFEPYDPLQIERVVELARDILARNPGIAPEDVVGHADIAPDRRTDPGPLFPWHYLYERGIGAWFDEAIRDRYLSMFSVEPPDLETIQRALAAWGYAVAITGVDDAQTQRAVSAFQMHFRPRDYTGSADAETAAILFALLEKYRSRALTALLDDSL